MATRAHNAIFDIHLTNVNANSQKNQTVETILRKHEKENKSAYDSRIMNVGISLIRCKLSFLILRSVLKFLPGKFPPGKFPPWKIHPPENSHPENFHLEYSHPFH